MQLVFIYGVLFIGIIALYFNKSNRFLPFRKQLLTAHFFFFVVLVSLVLSGLSLKGQFTNQMLSLCFLVSAPLIFALYRKQLPLIFKIYFGFFFYYPIAIVPMSMINTPIGYVFGMGISRPLAVPEKISSGNQYEIRKSIEGFLAPKQVVLIKKENLFEKEIGKNSDEEWFDNPPAVFLVKLRTEDSTIVQATVAGRLKNFTFYN